MSNPIIQVKNLYKEYEGGVKAVNGVSFDVARGEFFGFLGPNGAGKSTTMNMLVNLVKKTSGTILIDGFDVSTQPNEVYKRDQIAKLLKLVELEKVADKYTSTYSGGMRRRFDLALALIHKPSVLFLDEPTTGLDPHARQLIWSHLRELNQGGMTIFLTTHVMEEAEALCDRLAIMDKGEIVTEGTILELLAKHNAENLEAIFLATTGSNLADEEVNSKASDPYVRNR
jgi:ABC-2 type transport system ATP-binding protein